MCKKILLFVTILFIVSSCSKDQGIILPAQEGSISFSFSNPDLGLKKAKKLADLTPTAIFISIVNNENETVVSNQRFDLLTFGTSYITDEIELIEGDYQITAFNIVNAENAVIYASPLTGSINAEFVNNPLPIAFSVTGNQSNTISPEVILVSEDSTPEDFGYTSFSFTIVDIEPETQDLYLTITDPNNDIADGNVLIEIPTQNFSLDAAIFVDHIPITIPATEDNEEVIITVFYEGYDEQVFTLESFQIGLTNEQEPFEVVFDTVTDPETINLYLYIYQYDAPSFFSNGGAYTYTTTSGNSGEGIFNPDQQKIELPYTNDDEVYTIKFYHGSFNNPKTETLTTEQVFATNISDRFEVYFGLDGEQQIGISNDVRKLYIKVYQDESVDGNPNQPLPCFYTADIGNLGFYQEGYLPISTTNSVIELPNEDHNELTLSFTYNGLYADASFNSTEAITYSDPSTPLIIYLK